MDLRQSREFGLEQGLGLGLELGLEGDRDGIGYHAV